ncbi:hypothetical protein E0H93_34835 [Rhizobium leguminosarum bv. viciae]|uniref:hypothetical protein n=1 Tax=Rhizobium leguminosarum TaxID=384 RepID=UPI0010403A99|nr:hypothetical protein [Rhizobium leguminosarum]MBY5530194.1 hypothetical protein [Rhizobium leguminosarum]TBY30666.1 hypothetical protein E0H55_20505 [Rhizobium leguminosarum bv. viciae]TBY35724.1 hypothetical protein E0H60_22880 [Rhizobium leguminosarum bv. viciae]TCA94814.1 hypothetical protein E0H93_34835 [Rhizobium leguminosarum bv. viciae]
MTIKLNIDRLVIDAAAGQRLDPVALKAAVERQLAGLIEAGGVQAISGAPIMTFATRSSPKGARSEALVAQAVAARIYEAMKR